MTTSLLPVEFSEVSQLREMFYEFQGGYLELILSQQTVFLHLSNKMLWVKGGLFIFASNYIAMTILLNFFRSITVFSTNFGKHLS